MNTPGKSTPALKPWRPVSEAEATGTPALFLEWGRATGALPPAVDCPAALQTWRLADPAGCAEAAARFAGLRPTETVIGNLLRHDGARAALRMRDAAGAYQTLSFADLRRSLPGGVAAALAGLDWPALTQLALSHLLVADTRPDDVLHWMGPPDAAWPLGAWIVGACVMPGGPEVAGARVFHRAPAATQATRRT